MKQLIVDYIPFDIPKHKITESMKENNGKLVVKYMYQSEHMKKLIAKSKFKTMPLFAKETKGRIGLQGDHGEIWYRNIRIRKL